MHPQVHSPRFISCHEYIEALEECHQTEFLKRCFGLCNNQKEALSKCLHEARIEGQKYQFYQSRQKKAAMEAKWKKSKEEEYGEDEFLKKLLEREIAKKSS